MKGAVLMGDRLLIAPEHVATFCRPGKAGCCAFLASRELPNYFCAKGDRVLVVEIRRRLAEGTFGATGDNCSGPPGYVPRVPA